MGKLIELKAADGHTFGAYRADPAGKPRGGLIVIQEIFGVNKHMREVVDEFARDGYAAIAPALFDREKRGYESGYEPAEVEASRKIMQAMKWENVLADVAAAAAALKPAGKVGIVGYCWGGTVAWLAATRLPGLACSVPYYGGGIPGFAGEQPKCPVQFHWGETDHAIPMESVRKVEAAHPGIPSFVYPAGHGFSCSDRASYHAESTKLARSRTMEFLQKHIG